MSKKLYSKGEKRLREYHQMKKRGEIRKGKTKRVWKSMGMDVDMMFKMIMKSNEEVMKR